MTFNPNADVSGNKAHRRGRNAAVAGGGVLGIGAIVVVLMEAFGFGALTPLVDGIFGGNEQEQPPASITECNTGADANKDDACRIAAASLAIDQFWDANVQNYREPTLTVVDGSTNTPCGVASNAVGPFYCPPNEGIYIDPAFWPLLRQQFGASAGELAQLYVLAHEYGHHIQNITGIMAENPNNGTGATSNGVRMELQADCFAGAWVGAMTEQKDANGVPYLQAPSEKQIADALNAAAVVGDDHIQSQSGRVPNPDSWTHGSSAQRQFWFATGYQHGLGQCDVFAVPASEL